MDDIARPHRFAEVSDTLESGNIKRMEWPDCSSDLNHNKYASIALGRYVSQKKSPSAKPVKTEKYLEREVGGTNIPKINVIETL